jgi:hypothetical protein
MKIATKSFLILLSVITVVAVALSSLWNVPYIYTLIGFAAWAFIGHVVTADDDVPGGWSNPDGTLPFPWGELVMKGAILVGLCAIAVFFPSVRSLGVAP